MSIKDKYNSAKEWAKRNEKIVKYTSISLAVISFATTTICILAKIKANDNISNIAQPISDLEPNTNPTFPADNGSKIVTDTCTKNDIPTYVDQGYLEHVNRLAKKAQIPSDEFHSINAWNNIKHTHISNSAVFSSCIKAGLLKKENGKIALSNDNIPGIQIRDTRKGPAVEFSKEFFDEVVDYKKKFEKFFLV